MSFTLTEGDGAGVINITLYDLTGAVEHAIYESASPETGVAGGTFSFGYLNGKRSQTYSFDIESYQPAFVGNAFMISINATTLLSPFISNNPYSGTVMDVLQKMADNHNMTLKVDPPFGTEFMQDIGYTDVDTTAATEMVHTKWVNDSDAEFINRLLQWARDAEGKGGYKYAIIDGGDGKAVLNINKAKESSSGDFKYIVQDEESVVVAWRPEINFSSVVNGQNDVQSNSIQRMSGDPAKNIAQQSNTKPFQSSSFGLPNSPQLKATPPKKDAEESQYWGQNLPKEATDNSVRNRPAASSSPGAGFNPFLNSHLWAWADTYQATLTILGDPDVVPTMQNGSVALCDVTCYWPTNYAQKQSKQLHYTSGLYEIESVTHSIHAGEYLTTLSLSRASSETPAGAESEDG